MSAEQATDWHPRELGEVAAKVRELTEQRDAAIVDAVANGVPMREVARAAGMSHTAVRHIVTR